ncbi:hypothetical protein [Lysinibacillus capsici]|uniref:hypothetical protein n=1 Tax=Lysinibacillus capsici TaxID=2115968 RepID=UPI000E20BA6F|nr:hypothetical protein [Lysinibacillus capsici]RDV26297.1 hypothetical protein C7B89_21950 [Lysinibacillus capsici]
MTTKIIGMKEDKGTDSNCNCGGSLVYQNAWDDLFDRYDPNTSSHDEIYSKIYNRDHQAKYICNKCKLEVFVIPDYQIKK